MVLSLFEIIDSFEKLVKFFNLFSRKMHKYIHTFSYPNLERVTASLKCL